MSKGGGTGIRGAVAVEYTTSFVEFFSSTGSAAPDADLAGIHKEIGRISSKFKKMDVWRDQIPVSGYFTSLRQLFYVEKYIFALLAN